MQEVTTRASTVAGLGAVLLVACQGQPTQQPAGSPCEEAVDKTGNEIQKTAEVLASDAVAKANEEPLESGSEAADGGTAQQVPQMLRTLAEAHGRDSAMAQVDRAVSEAADACGGRTIAYDEISQHLEQRVPRYMEQQGWPTSPTPEPSEISPSTYMASTLLAVTAEEFGRAADSAQAETPGESPTS